MLTFRSSNHFTTWQRPNISDYRNRLYGHCPAELEVIQTQNHSKKAAPSVAALSTANAK